MKARISGILAMVLLGTGLSVSPAQAEVGSFAITKTTGALLTVVESVATAAAQEFSIYSKIANVPLADVKVDPNGTYTAADDIRFAAGTKAALTSTAAASSRFTFATVDGGALPNIALSAYTADTTTALTAITATTSGAPYLLWEDAEGEQD